MISLDQVLLLQKKVETAVEKIAFLKGQIEQLKSENDALHTKCAELTKALDEKTELVSSLESNQGKIEEGIISALNRLDTMENSILDGSASPDNQNQESSDSQEQVTFDQQAPIETEQAADSSSEESNQAEQTSNEVQQEPFRYEIVPDEENSEEENSSEDNADSLNGQFDIF
ncbi:MAG: cell division protein ZapB [Treponema sp.]|nr:cell division protein ZapB [Treponema sp.]